MLEAARRSTFDVIVSESLDRLSRDQEDVAAAYKGCSFAGVRIITITEGVVSELQVGLNGTMNALFLSKLAGNTRRGLRGRIVAGFAAGGITYGYAVALDVDHEGKLVRGARRIVEAQAAIVRRIFCNYADGVSPKMIATTLNAEGIKAPKGGAWSPSTINGNRRRGTGILNNELYAGWLVWNRQRYGKDPETDNRVPRPNAEEDVERTKVPHLRIVDDKLWQRVRERQGKLDKQAEVSGGAAHAKQRPRSIFSGLMRCGVCGAGFSNTSGRKS